MDIPVIAEADMVIVGGGVSGISATIAWEAGQKGNIDRTLCRFKEYNPLPEPKIYHCTYALFS